MTKVSTSPFFFKRVFPALWFGFIVLFLVLSVSFGAYKESLMFIVMPIGMSVFGFFFFKHFLWDLADEVIDEGDALIISKGKQKHKVRLIEIINVNHQLSSPERVKLTLRNKELFDGQVAFIPPFRFNLLSKNKFVDDLIERVDRARNT